MSKTPPDDPDHRDNLPKEDEDNCMSSQEGQEPQDTDAECLEDLGNWGAFTVNPDGSKIHLPLHPSGCETCDWFIDHLELYEFRKDRTFLEAVAEMANRWARESITHPVSIQKQAEARRQLRGEVEDLRSQLAEKLVELEEERQTSERLRRERDQLRQDSRTPHVPIEQAEERIRSLNHLKMQADDDALEWHRRSEGWEACCQYYEERYNTLMAQEMATATEETRQQGIEPASGNLKSLYRQYSLKSLLTRLLGLYRQV